DQVFFCFKTLATKYTAFTPVIIANITDTVKLSTRIVNIKSMQRITFKTVDITNPLSKFLLIFFNSFYCFILISLFVVTYSTLFFFLIVFFCIKFYFLSYKLTINISNIYIY